MARIIPHGWQNLPLAGAAQREVETLTRLAETLPADYTVYHGVHWTRLQHGVSFYGEIDFAIVAPSGRTLLIEQKSGFLTETPEGLVKAYGSGSQNVAARLARNADGVQGRFSAAHQGESLPLETMLYCPDYIVRQPAAAGVDPARIVDAARRAQFPRLIEAALPLFEPASPLAAKAHRFFRDLLELTPEIGAIADQAESLYTRLSGGLTDWARQITFEPFRLRVEGTAGSGKTQLALAVYRDAVAAGRRPLYVCYNRPLADHMALLVPPGGEVATYHQVCERVIRRRGGVLDFSRAGVFEAMEARFGTLAPGPGEAFDELIVDEGQDFRAAWGDALLAWLTPGGRAWWLEDPMQNLYGREPVARVGWVCLRAGTNYRSPGDVLGWIREHLALTEGVLGGSPVTDSGVEVLVYQDATGLVDQTKRAITLAVGQGFRRPMIGVVTFRGREHSRLASHTQLGPHQIRVPTGRYDLLGNPEYTEGEVLMDSVYRFKGRSAPCVVFTEIDFESLDERAARKLFVGATRATMKLVLVVSSRAAGLLGLSAGRNEAN